MQLIRERLAQAVKKSLEDTYEPADNFEPEIELPSISQHGDYSTNVAMVLSKPLKKKPRELAVTLADKIKLLCSDDLEKIEIAGPGFINFFVAKKTLHEIVICINQEGDAFGCCNVGNNRYVQVEFVSANPTGPLHIGHGRGAAIGDAISRILKACGYNVHKEYYINDVGKQMNTLGHSLYLRCQELLGRPVEFPDDYYKGQYMKDLAKDFIREKGTVYADSPEEEVLSVFSQFAAERILEGIKKDLDDFGVHYDEWFSEALLHEQGTVEKALDVLREKGHIYQKDGALWFRSSSFGDEKDRVVVRSNGAKTYFAADVAYHWNKIQRDFDLIIDIWGADHHGYVPRLKAVVEAMGFNQEKLKIILVQLVNLVRSGQPIAMSTRAGEFVTLREVMDEVGVDAARYIFLTRRSDSPLDFDLDLAKAKNSENPVYYAQYAHARINSLFQVAQEKSIFLDEDKAIASLHFLEEPQELELMKLLGEFPQVVKNSALFLEPHRIPYYLHNLVSLFHNYYNHCRVLTDGEGVTQARLYLSRAIQIVVKNSLALMGVSAPDRM